MFFLFCRRESRVVVPRQSGGFMEAAGIAPASREASVRASTCVADRLVVGLRAPVGRIPFGLSRHVFNLNCNKRLSSDDPELASPAVALGRSRVAGPLLFFRQRDGDQQCCWQLSFGRLFTRPADQPRHATVHFGHPVDPSSPPVPSEPRLTLLGVRASSSGVSHCVTQREQPQHSCRWQLFCVTR